MLDEEMADPREALARRESEWKESEIVGAESRGQADEAQHAADEARRPAASGRMFAHVTTLARAHLIRGRSLTLSHSVCNRLFRFSIY